MQPPLVGRLVSEEVARSNQHNTHWIPDGSNPCYEAVPGAGDVLVLNNGRVPDREWTFLAHQGQSLMTGDAPLPNTQFRAWPQQSGPQQGGAIRLSPILLRDQHLFVGENGVVSIGTAARAGSDMFRHVPGPAEGTVRIESLAFPGQALARSDSGIALAAIDSGNTVWKLD